MTRTALRLGGAALLGALPLSRAQFDQPPFVKAIADLSPPWRAELYRRVPARKIS